MNELQSVDPWDPLKNKWLWIFGSIGVLLILFLNKKMHPESARR